MDLGEIMRVVISDSSVLIDLAKVIRGEKKLAWDAAHDIAVHETVLLASR